MSRSAEAPLRSLTGRPLPRLFNPVNMLADNLVSTEKDASFLQHVEETSGRFDWSFNLCAVTLANFNYRKMSLVRDFDALVEEPAQLGANFHLMFGDTPRAAPSVAPDVADAERFTVVASDPTQEAAVLAARNGISYVIQGPPGTGKSQTITNLIADFVGRGKRVLFVCEKRAALDVVHNRLKGAGLGSSTALFHDSQSDRGDFIRELSALYTGWIETQPATTEKELQARRAGELGRIAEARNDIAQLVTTMSKTAKGADVPVHELLTETLAGNQPPLQLDDRLLRLLPDYRSWAASRDAVARAMAGIRRATGQATLAGQAAGMIAQSRVVDRGCRRAGRSSCRRGARLRGAPAGDRTASGIRCSAEPRRGGHADPARRQDRARGTRRPARCACRRRRGAGETAQSRRQAGDARPAGREPGAQGRVLEPSAVAGRGRAGACSGGTPEGGLSRSSRASGAPPGSPCCRVFRRPPARQCHASPRCCATSSQRRTRRSSSTRNRRVLPRLIDATIRPP